MRQREYLKSLGFYHDNAGVCSDGVVNPEAGAGVKGLHSERRKNGVEADRRFGFQLKVVGHGLIGKRFMFSGYFMG